MLLKKFIAISVTCSFVLVHTGLTDAAPMMVTPAAKPAWLPQIQLQPPAELGHVSDYFNASGGSDDGKMGSETPLVILVQDLHANYSVQKNISGLLQFLSKKLSSTEVSSSLPSLPSSKLSAPFALAVEGASGPIDLSVMALFPDQKIKEKALDFLMKEAELSGAEHYAAITKQPNLLMGVEDEELYDLNRDVFKTSFENRERLANTLEALQTQFNQYRARIYSRPLKRFQSQVNAFEKGRMHTEAYLNEVVLAAQDQRIDWKKAHPLLARYIQGYQNSNNINRQRIDFDPNLLREQTSQFLKTIESRLSDREKETLKGLAAKQLGGHKELSPSDYYLYLRDLVYSKQLFAAISPELASYLEYLKTTNSQGLDEVLFEAKKLVRVIKRELSSKDAQVRDFVQVEEDLDLLLRMVNLKANEFEVRDFAPRINQFVAMTKALLKKDVSYDLKSLIVSSVDFYILALSRNEPMVNNTLALIGLQNQIGRIKDGKIGSNKIKQKNKKENIAKTKKLKSVQVSVALPSLPSLNPPVAVLVAGGFHTQELTAEFRKRNVSYVVMTPNVESVSEKDHELYVKRLNGGFLKNEEIIQGVTSVASAKNKFWSKNALSGLAVLIPQQIKLRHFMLAAATFAGVFAAGQMNWENFSQLFAQIPSAHDLLLDLKNQLSQLDWKKAGLGASAIASLGVGVFTHVSASLQPNIAPAARTANITARLQQASVAFDQIVRFAGIDNRSSDTNVGNVLTQLLQQNPTMDPNRLGGLYANSLLPNVTLRPEQRAILDKAIAVGVLPTSDVSLKRSSLSTSQILQLSKEWVNWVKGESAIDPEYIRLGRPTFLNDFAKQQSFLNLVYKYGQTYLSDHPTNDFDRSLDLLVDDLALSTQETGNILRTLNRLKRLSIDPENNIRFSESEIGFLVGELAGGILNVLERNKKVMDGAASYQQWKNRDMLETRLTHPDTYKAGKKFLQLLRSWGFTRFPNPDAQIGQDKVNRWIEMNFSPIYPKEILNLAWRPYAFVLDHDNQNDSTVILKRIFAANHVATWTWTGGMIGGALTAASFIAAAFTYFPFLTNYGGWGFALSMLVSVVSGVGANIYLHRKHNIQNPDAVLTRGEDPLIPLKQFDEDLSGGINHIGLKAPLELKTTLDDKSLYVLNNLGVTSINVEEKNETPLGIRIEKGAHGMRVFVSQQVVSKHVAAIGIFLVGSVYRAHVQDWGVSISNIERLGLNGAFFEEPEKFELLEFLDFVSVLETILPMLKSEVILKSLFENGFVLQIHPFRKILKREWIERVYGIQERHFRKTFSSPAKLLDGDIPLIERVAKRIEVRGTGRAEDVEYEGNIIRRGNHFLRKLMSQLHKTGLTAFERHLFQTLDREKSVPINWNLKQSGGSAGVQEDMRLFVGGIHASSQRDLMGDVDKIKLPSGNAYFTFKHESGHIADYVSNVPGLNWKHPTQPGIITHRRLYAEFRANLWASNGQFDLAFQRTWATYGLKDFMTQFNIETKNPEEVYFILKTLSENMEDHVTDETIARAREIVAGPMSMVDETSLGKLLSIQGDDSNTSRLSSEASHFSTISPQTFKIIRQLNSGTTSNGYLVSYQNKDFVYVVPKDLDVNDNENYKPNVSTERRTSNQTNIVARIRYESSMASLHYQGRSIVPKVEALVQEGEYIIGYLSEYIPGDRLSDLARNGLIPFDELDQIHAQLREQLSIIHKAGKVHGDPSMGNAIIQKEKDKIIARWIDFSTETENADDDMDSFNFFTVEASKTALEPKNVQIYRQKQEIIAREAAVRSGESKELLVIFGVPLLGYLMSHMSGVATNFSSGGPAFGMAMPGLALINLGPTAMIVTAILSIAALLGIGTYMYKMRNGPHQAKTQATEAVTAMAQAGAVTNASELLPPTVRSRQNIRQIANELYIKAAA